MAYTPEGERELKHWFSSARRKKLWPRGPNLLQLHAEQDNSGILETYRFADLAAACWYLARNEPNLHKGLYCGKDLGHPPNCNLCSSCHWCRQKTDGHKARCTSCDSTWCPSCLWNRHGESVAEIGPNKRYPSWVCPICRGICNCSAVNCQRAGAQWLTTGQMGSEARRQQYASVALYLMKPYMDDGEEVTEADLNEAVQVIQLQNPRLAAINWPGMDPEGTTRRWLERHRRHVEHIRRTGHAHGNGKIQMHTQLKPPPLSKSERMKLAQTRRFEQLKARVETELPIQEALEPTQALAALGLTIGLPAGMGPGGGGDNDEDDVAAWLSRPSGRVVRMGGRAMDMVGLRGMGLGQPPAQQQQQQQQNLRGGGDNQAGTGGGGVGGVGGGVDRQDGVMTTWGNGQAMQELGGNGQGRGAAVGAGAGGVGAGRLGLGGMGLGAGVGLGVTVGPSGGGGGGGRNAGGGGGPAPGGGGGAPAGGGGPAPGGGLQMFRQEFLTHPFQNRQPVLGMGSGPFAQPRNTASNKRAGWDVDMGGRMGPIGQAIRGQGGTGPDEVDGPMAKRWRPGVTDQGGHRVGGGGDLPGQASMMHYVRPHSRSLPRQHAAPDAVDVLERDEEDDGLWDVVTGQHVPAAPPPPPAAIKRGDVGLGGPDAGPGQIGARTQAGNMPGAMPRVNAAGGGAAGQAHAVLDMDVDVAHGVESLEDEKGYSLYRPTAEEGELDFFGGLLAQATKEVNMCAARLHDASLTRDEKQQAMDMKQEVLQEIWDQMQNVVVELTVALCINEMPELCTGRPIETEVVSQPAHEYLRTYTQLKNAAGLLLTMVQEADDEHGIVYQAVRLLFGHELFVDFKRCDSAARAVLVYHGFLMIKALRKRRLQFEVAVSGFSRWLVSQVEEHSDLVKLLDLGLSPSQPINMGLVQLAACPASSEAMSTALPSNRAVLDPRTDTVKSYAESVTDLLKRMVCKCTDLCQVLGPESYRLLRPGVVDLLKPHAVDPAVSCAAFNMIAAIFVAAKPKRTGGMSECSEAALYQGITTADAFKSQVLETLELLVMWCHPERQKPEVWRVPASQVLPLASNYPSELTWNTLQQVELRQQAKARRDILVKSVAHLPRSLLGLIYGALLWAGKLCWRAVLQQLLLSDQAASGDLLVEKSLPLRQFAVSSLAIVVQHMRESPPMHPRVQPPDGPLPMYVLRVWILALLDMEKWPVAELSVQLAQTPEVQHLMEVASHQLSTNSLLAEALGPLQFDQYNMATQGSPAGTGQAVAGAPSPALQLPTTGQQAAGGAAPGVADYSCERLLALWNMVARDMDGSVRGALLSCLLVGIRPDDGKLGEVLADLDKAWNLGKVLPAQGGKALAVVLKWQSSMILITLRVLKVTLALRQYPPPGVLSGVQAALQACCKVVVAGTLQLWRQGSGSGITPDKANLTFLQGLDKGPISHLQMCISLLLTTTRTTDLNAPNTTYGTPRGDAVGRPPASTPSHILLYEVLCLALFLPSYADLPSLDSRGYMQANPTSLAGMDGYALQQHILECLINAMFVDTAAASGGVMQAPRTPHSPAAVRTGTASNIAWSVLQWLVWRLRDVVAEVFKKQRSIDLKRQEEALMALRLIRVVLTDDRMGTTTALSWLLPPLMSLTVETLSEPVTSSVLLPGIYQMWEQLLPCLADHGLLGMPQLVSQDGQLRDRCWTGPLMGHQLNQAVFHTLKAMCCHMLGSALEVVDKSKAGPAQQRLCAVLRSHPQVWTHVIWQSCNNVNLLLGKPVTLQNDLLKQAKQNAGAVLSDGKNSEPPGDRYFKVLEAQLDFSIVLTSAAPVRGSHVWGAHVLPGLHTVLRCGEDDAPTLDGAIAARLTRLAEAEHQARHQAAEVHASTPPPTLWCYPLLLSQLLQVDNAWRGAVVAVLDSIHSKTVNAQVLKLRDGSSQEDKQMVLVILREASNILRFEQLIQAQGWQPGQFGLVLIHDAEYKRHPPKPYINCTSIDLNPEGVPQELRHQLRVSYERYKAQLQRGEQTRPSARQGTGGGVAAQSMGSGSQQASGQRGQVAQGQVSRAVVGQTRAQQGPQQRMPQAAISPVGAVPSIDGGDTGGSSSGASAQVAPNRRAVVPGLMHLLQPHQQQRQQQPQPQPQRQQEQQLSSQATVVQPLPRVSGAHITQHVRDGTASTTQSY